MGIVPFKILSKCLDLVVYPEKIITLHKVVYNNSSVKIVRKSMPPFPMVLYIIWSILSWIQSFMCNLPSLSLRRRRFFTRIDKRDQGSKTLTNQAKKCFWSRYAVHLAGPRKLGSQNNFQHPRKNRDLRAIYCGTFRIATWIEGEEVWVQHKFCWTLLQKS